VRRQTPTERKGSEIHEASDGWKNSMQSPAYGGPMAVRDSWKSLIKKIVLSLKTEQWLPVGENTLVTIVTAESIT
jgi:hypothetical protein